MDRLPIMETFPTIQGEGHYSGHAAWFIRTGGCDVGCVWCDVKESWDVNAHPLRKVSELVEEASANPARIAVITGGEPAMHSLEALTSGLKEAGFRTHIETSGTSELDGTWDWITYSPKKFKAPLPEVAARANELKVVVYHPSDIAWAIEMAKGVGPDCIKMLQPEWSKQEKMLPEILRHIQRQPDWRVSLQTHKFMQIP